ncbi:MAG: DUF1579 domain-containing protein [Candidatus Eisenbacteria bacterium]|uniref:DUF1579 domain-containing protein n=1 Tax=Eiseniibacteriota bacterium TaxID=2212470 RepID=A0A538SY00_UNCEI|nr:MAG: DUF1579 domain-containing protein [Candidatus Eisenbacteria bacterium]
MKTRLLMCVALLVAVSGVAPAQEATKSKTAGAGGAKASAAQPKMDPQAMAEMMAKMAAPGPSHERFKQLAGEWNLTVKWTMDPSQPMQVTTSTSTITTLMDGRYCQEQSAGEMMGKPFQGMGLTGYDNVLKKFVSVWIDNMGTGIMSSQGTADASGNVINWTAESPDPATGKMTKYRQVTRYLDDNHHVFEMYVKSPDGKEFKTMEIAYERKM